MRSADVARWRRVASAGECPRPVPPQRKRQVDGAGVRRRPGSGPRRQCLLALALLLPAGLCAAEPFRLGIISERPDRPSFVLEQYEALHGYLGARLAERGIAMDELVVARDLDAMAGLVDAGGVDAVIEGVMPSLKLKRRTGRIDPRLLVWRKGQRHYHSVFFSRRDSPIEGLQDLAGKRIAFENPRSTSAYDVPRAALIEAGLTLAHDSAGAPDAAPDRAPVRYRFAGSELNQAYWVHAGRADAGAFNNGDWQRVPISIKTDLRIFHRTRPILRWLFSFVTPIEPHARGAVTDILVKMHQDPTGHAALQAASRITKLERLTTEDREDLAYWDAVLGRLERPTATSD